MVPGVHVVHQLLPGSRLFAASVGFENWSIQATEQAQ
jgi:hypothetical protein